MSVGSEVAYPTLGPVTDHYPEQPTVRALPRRSQMLDNKLALERYGMKAMTYTKNLHGHKRIQPTARLPK